MSRFYKEKGFTLARADRPTRVLVSCFLLCVLVGVVGAALQYSSRSGGFDSNSAQEWVLGNEDDLSATEFRVAKGDRELLAFVHDHIFSLAMVLFVVFHLVALTPLHPRGKIGLVLLGFGGLLGTLGVPWLLRAAPSDLKSWLLICSGSALLISLALGSLLVLGEMWIFPSIRRVQGRPEAPPANPMYPQAQREES